VPGPIHVDVDNAYRVIDVIAIALMQVNKELAHIKSNLTLEPSPELFEIRLANKQGLPKEDYPALDPIQKLNRSGFSNRLCLTEITPGMGVANSETSKQRFPHNHSVASTTDTCTRKSVIFVKGPVAVPEPSKGLCSCFSGLFGKPKADSPIKRKSSLRRTPKSRERSPKLTSHS